MQLLNVPPQRVGRDEHRPLSQCQRKKATNSEYRKPHQHVCTLRHNPRDLSTRQDASLAGLDSCAVQCSYNC